MIYTAEDAEVKVIKLLSVVVIVVAIDVVVVTLILFVVVYVGVDSERGRCWS